MISDYYVYVLLDSSKKGDYVYNKYTFEYEPFYIGKGRGKRIKDTLYDNSPFKRNKISKLKRNGIEIISLKIKEGLSNEEAISNEIELISIVGRRDLNKGPLVNNTDGGDGRVNSKHSKEVIEKISKNRKGKGIGWKHTEETLGIMRENQKGNGNGFYGKKHSLKNRKEQSDRVSGLLHPMFGKKHSKETIDILIKHREENISNEKIKEACQKFNKPVLMYDLQFNLINEFKSVKEASKNTGINESIISKCCRGDIKSPTRYFFRYKNKEDNIKNNKFIINTGDFFSHDNRNYKLIKRNKKTCISEFDGDLITIKNSDCEILNKKETNDINLVELYLYLKNIDNKFKIKDDLIYNEKVKIKFVKYDKNCITDEEYNYIIKEKDWENKNSEIKKKLNFLIERRVK